MPGNSTRKIFALKYYMALPGGALFFENSYWLITLIGLCYKDKGETMNKPNIRYNLIMTGTIVFCFVFLAIFSHCMGVWLWHGGKKYLMQQPLLTNTRKAAVGSLRRNQKKYLLKRKNVDIWQLSMKISWNRKRACGPVVIIFIIKTINQIFVQKVKLRFLILTIAPCGQTHINRQRGDDETSPRSISTPKRRVRFF